MNAAIATATPTKCIINGIVFYYDPMTGSMGTWKDAPLMDYRRG